MYIKSLIILSSITFVYSQEYTYSLEDVNSSSFYYEQYISPSGFTGQVTLHYFGHQNWGTCSARVGNLHDLYQDLQNNRINNVQIISIGRSAFSNNNGNWTNGNSIPVLVDPSPYNVWSTWGADQWDLFFLDLNGNYETKFNISTWDYDRIYNTILALSSQ